MQAAAALLAAAACLSGASALRPFGSTEGENATTYTHFPGECRTESLKVPEASAVKSRKCQGSICTKEACEFVCTLDSDCLAFEVGNATCKLHTTPVSRGSGSKSAECHVKKEFALYGKMACECLPWNKVYKYGGVKCGSGFEFFGYAHGSGAHREPGVDGMYNDQELCRDIPGHPGTTTFLWQHHNYCVKKDVKGSYEEAWCYVSAECNKLQGGAKVVGDAGDLFAYKECLATDDGLLSDRSPKELARLAQQDPSVPKYAWKFIANLAYSHLEGRLKESDPLGFELKLKQAATRDEPVKYLDDRGNLFAWKGKQGVVFGESGWTLCLRDCHSIVPLYTGDDAGWKEAQALMTPMDWHAMTTM